MPNMIGAYGDWASGLAQDPPRLSFRRAGWANLGEWQRQARAKYLAALLQPDTGGVPKAIVQHAVEFDGLAFEHMTWQLPYGPPTEAVFVKPVGATGKLPGVLALHDHGGNKYFGTRKLIRMSADPHPMMIEHQNRYYGGAAWVNELARRGYGVLVSDAFTFGSRRVRVGDVPAAIRQGLTEQNPEATDEIQKYNTWAAGHEHIMAKSLFSAGTTWPGTFVGEDQRALDYLCSRPDVDASKVGCCGLSGGGAADSLPDGRGRAPQVLLRGGDDDDLAGLSDEQVVHPHLDGVRARNASGTRLPRDLRSESAQRGDGSE
jgi:dienelactone hydrolase